MKRYIMLCASAGLLHLFTCAAPAEPVVTESFDYPTGLLTNNAGTGWSGPWNIDDDGGSAGVNDNAFEVQSPGLSFATLPVAGNKIGRINTANRAVAWRVPSAPSLSLLTGDNTTIWFSVLYQDSGTGDDFAFLFSTEKHVPPGQDPGLAAAGNAFGFASIGSSIYAVKCVSSTVQTTSTGTLAANTGTYLLVGKINWKPNGTVDECFIFNVTDNESVEPAEGTAFASHTADFNQSAFDIITLWDRPGTQGLLDEIRFGRTYEEVMGRGSLKASVVEVK